ncbi:hypothetical protein GCM10007242_10940 [Pigmentiphaga litoralis]|jgi:hypothetical protein|uniref:hypothetical protein n=1 Tax=Pigmentiphaga litoralis TaxID=516702 RepID=UPI00167843CA|nr:hypothetical protein [Pigmentiphaga litoralis]GGX07324.1 hypothetical protein GCM10007242_10940 [Pigmentiphaga litoralis]
MKRLLASLVCGSVLAVALSGCIVVPRGGGGGPHYHGGHYSQGPYYDRGHHRGGYRR